MAETPDLVRREQHEEAMDAPSQDSIVLEYQSRETTKADGLTPVQAVQMAATILVSVVLVLLAHFPLWEAGVDFFRGTRRSALASVSLIHFLPLLAVIAVTLAGGLWLRHSNKWGPASLGLIASSGFALLTFFLCLL